VTLYAIEEQEIYREMYKLAFSVATPVSLMGVSSPDGVRQLKSVVAEHSPDVLIMGSRKFNKNIIKELQKIRQSNAGLGVVFLFSCYEPDSIELLTELALMGEAGMAVLLKQSLDEVEQLKAIVMAVSHGEIILDPSIVISMSANKPIHRFLKRLSGKELQILSLMSKGYTNSSIATSLGINTQTVEQYVNSMYGTLQVEVTP